LEHLTLVSSGDIDEDFELEAFEHAPRLESVTIHYYNLVSTARLPWSQLTSIILKSGNKNELPALLSLCPKLDSLDTRGGMLALTGPIMPVELPLKHSALHFLDVFDPYTLQALHQVHLPALTVLKAYEFPHKDDYHLFRNLIVHTPNLKTLDMGLSNIPADTYLMIMDIFRLIPMVESFTTRLGSWTTPFEDGELDLLSWCLTVQDRPEPTVLPNLKKLKISCQAGDSILGLPRTVTNSNPRSLNPNFLTMLESREHRVWRGYGDWIRLSFPFYRHWGLMLGMRTPPIRTWSDF
jgi:hypothetical protein